MNETKFPERIYAHTDKWHDTAYCEEKNRCLPNQEYIRADIVSESNAADMLIRLDRLQSLIGKLHSAKGRHHTQIAICDLFDAVGLSNARPTEKVKNVR